LCTFKRFRGLFISDFFDFTAKIIAILIAKHQKKSKCFNGFFLLFAHL